MNKKYKTYLCYKTFSDNFDYIKEGYIYEIYTSSNDYMIKINKKINGCYISNLICSKSFIIQHLIYIPKLKLSKYKIYNESLLFDK